MKGVQRKSRLPDYDQGTPKRHRASVRFLYVGCGVLTVLWIMFTSPCHTAVANTLDDLRRHIGKQDGVMVCDSNGKILFSKNELKKLIPASTLKILTSLVALHYLGTDYRFTTEFYLDRNENLKVKGYGDPLLISEVLSEIANVISKKLVRFNDLILDGSYYRHPITIPGVSSSFEPYDAPNGALCVNFNTVYFEKNEHGRYISAETQTPLLPVVLNRLEQSQLRRGRIVLSAERNEFLNYAGHLILYFLKDNGITANGRIRIGRVNTEKDTLIFRYYSKFSLRETVMRLLDHSNNFMANQIMISAGAKVYGPPGTLEKGVRLVSNYAENVLHIPDIRIAEGSGISRENQISANDLNRVLETFEPYRHLMPYRERTFYKTGTLNGVRTMAGYVVNENEEVYRFVLLFNTPGKSTGPILDRILDTID